jgi:hypothetical protein
MDTLLFKLGLLTVVLAIGAAAVAWRVEVLTRAEVGLHQVVEATR